MKKYYISKRSSLNGNFSVHRERCPFLPETEKRIYLGKFNSCTEAVKVAKMVCLKSDGCYFCLKICSQIDKKNLRAWSYPFNPKVAYSEN
jgi:hypothetical protein